MVIYFETYIFFILLIISIIIIIVFIVVDPNEAKREKQPKGNICLIKLLMTKVNDKINNMRNAFHLIFILWFYYYDVRLRLTHL